MVHREEHNENFTVVDNAVIQNCNLSWEARGFFLFLLSLPDDWSFSIKGLVKQTGATEYTVKRLLKELQSEGYIVLTRHTDKNGKVTSWSWNIYESGKTVQKSNLPQVEITTSGKSQKVAKPDSGFTTCGEIDSIQSTNNNKVLNKQSTKDNKVLGRFVAPTVEEVKAYCLERGNSVNPDQFVDFYTSKGWKVGKNPMKDWKAAVRTWEQRDNRAAQPKQLTSGNPFDELLRKEGYV